MAYDFSILLSDAEQRVFSNPSAWRWVTAARWDGVPPIHHPEHLKWSKESGGGHSLPNRELLICLSGRMLTTLRDDVYEVTPGTVVLFDTHDWHDKIASPYQGSGRCLWLHIPNRHIVSSNLYEARKDGSCYNEELKFTSAHMGDLITDVWDQCNEEPFSPLHWQFLKSSLTFMLFETASASNHTGEFDSKEAVVEELCEYIKTHLNEKLSLKQLAQVAGYNPYFLHRLFRRYHNKSPHNYIINARLDRAKELLCQGYTVEAICEEIGIYPPSYFSFFFQKHTQLSPSRWREIHGVSTLRDNLTKPRRRHPPKQRVPPRMTED